MRDLGVSYASFKSAAATLIKYYQPMSDGSFQIYCVTDDFFITCSISSDDDLADFAANVQPSAISVTSADDALFLGYLATGNVKLAPRTADGRTSVCLTVAKKTKNFKLRAVQFYSSEDGSATSVNPITDAEYGDITLTLQKWDGSAWVAATDVDAQRTIVDWDALYAFEIIGGWIDLPSDLKDGATDQWFLSCVGVPDYAAYGLAVDFVSQVNLEAVTTQKINSDGRATQYLSPTIAGGVNYHTNRLRWIVDHPAGAQKRFQIFVETFAG